MNNYTYNSHRNRSKNNTKKNIIPISGSIIEAIKIKSSDRDFSKHIIILNNDGLLQNKHKSLFHAKLDQSFPVFEHITNTENNTLGSCRLIEVATNSTRKTKIIVANLYTNCTIQDKQKIHYGLLALSLYDLKKQIDNMKKLSIEFGIEIHTTKIGCGTHGGDWNIVSGLISHILENDKVFIYNNQDK
jgi:hypothetical protein